MNDASHQNPQSPLLIAVDIGNSSIKIGYFSDSLLMVQRLPTDPLRKADEYRQLMLAALDQNKIAKSECSGIISSVVASHTEVFLEALAGVCPGGRSSILRVSSAMAGVSLRIPEPAGLGTDRIADGVAAFSLTGGPAAVINCGTATTISAVDREGCYIGGAIMPGIGLMNSALGSKTSQLMQVELVKPDAALGRHTAGCIRSGLIIGTAGAAERIVEEMEAETGLMFTLIVTGGYGPLIAQFVRRPLLERPDLTLEGLKILHEKNRA